MIIKTIIFESKGGTNTIHEAEYQGSPCFAVVHVPTGHIEIIDHDEALLKAISGRINRSRALTCDKKAKGHILKFYASRKERRITLRYFVYAKYHGLSLKEVRGKKICVLDDSAVKDNILDLRSCNLYDAGEVRPRTKDRTIEVVERPGHDGEKYIAISFHNRENGKVEYTEYSPELFEMLASPKYCNVGYNKQGDRATVSVHYGEGASGYLLDNLAKFVLVYHLHFSSYKNMRGSVKRFIHDYYKLSRVKYEYREAAHINSCRWNLCAENLLFMDADINNYMANFIKWFSEPYTVFTALDNTGGVLIEYTAPDMIRGGEIRQQLYKCPTPEDYLDWQKVFLGKALTGKLQVSTFAAKDGVQQVLTPCGMIATGEVSRETARENEPGFWSWLEHRDKLLAMDENAFYIWRAGAGRTLHGVQMPESIAPGQPLVVPYNGGYAVITPINTASEK